MFCEEEYEHTMKINFQIILGIVSVLGIFAVGIVVFDNESLSFETTHESYKNKLEKDDNLEENLEDAQDILSYLFWSRTNDSFLIKNYVRDNTKFVDGIISNCGKTLPISDFRISSIFYGDVLEIKNSTDPFEKIVTLNVEKSWYGNMSNTTQVVTDIEECGNAFEEHKKFLVFAIGEDPMFAPFYFISPKLGEIPEGTLSFDYDVDEIIEYMERTSLKTSNLDRILELKSQTEYAYNVLKQWEDDNDSTVGFGMSFISNDKNGLVEELDKGESALVVSLNVRNNPSITTNELNQLLKNMLGDIPILAYFGSGSILEE